MESFAKSIDPLSGRKGSDFGAVFPACLDKDLRERVSLAISTTRKNEEKTLDYDELREIATYISELENFILRTEAGLTCKEELLSILSESTGFDIKGKLAEWNALLAADQNSQ